MTYKENPKTTGSGILCAIPQTGICPNKCDDCFFQSGRSFLEPLDKNLPNMPDASECRYRVVRVNDGHDSNIMPKGVDIRWSTKDYPMKFYNTAIPKNIDIFDAPVVLTVNAAKRTDREPYLLVDIPKNLMFVRVRVNMWNLEDVVDRVVGWYTALKIPVVLTFMAYFDGEIPGKYQKYYTFRKRTLNSYSAITTAAWEMVMSRYKYNVWVHSCGKVEGELGSTVCRHCGNCLREYFATTERIND